MLSLKTILRNIIAICAIIVNSELYGTDSLIGSTPASSSVNSISSTDLPPLSPQKKTSEMGVQTGNNSDDSSSECKSPNKKDKFFETPLFHAETAAEVEKLVKCGAKVNYASPTGQTALHKAKLPDVVKALLAENANPNAQTHRGNGPLHQVPTEEIAQKLLTAGANPNATNKEGQTPLHMARSTDIARTILEHDFDNPLFILDVNPQDKHGNTPLHLAASPERIELLLKHGANANITNNIGKKPVDTAPAARDAAVATKLQELSKPEPEAPQGWGSWIYQKQQALADLVSGEQNNNSKDL